MDFESIKKEVEKTLSNKRYIHSCGVAKRAAELAKIYKEDEEKARLIGIAHDIAKEMSKEDALKYAEQNDIVFDEIEQKEPALWHSKIGADIACKKFGFDEKMKQAIIYHTIGNVNMNTMDKIIYLADKTEENRTYPDIEKARQLSEENIDLGVLYVAKKSILKALEKNSLIHPDTIALINKLILENK